MRHNRRESAMPLIAHIGNVPVEEWLPFLFPVLALYLYGRHWNHRRRQAVNRLPGADQPLDESSARLLISEWAKADHGEVSREHLPVLYPPGPDGATAAELASSANSDRVTMERLLVDLQELGYLDFEEREQRDGRRVWLTAEGYDLVNVTEQTLLAAARQRGPLPTAPRLASSGPSS
jgi:hypothetical protein